MITSNLENWKKAWDWISSSLSSIAEDGEYEISGRDVYASISTITPQPREELMFEAHDTYADIHICISGGEIIEYISRSNLGAPAEQNPEKDYSLFAKVDSTEKIVMTPGNFAVFMPNDAHMPKIFDGEHATCKKVVVKIKVK